MSKARLPPLDEDLQQLLENARGTEPAPPDIRERVFSAVADLMTADLTAAGTGARHSLVRAVAPSAARRALPIVVSFALGSAAGGAATRAWWPPLVSPAPLVSTPVPLSMGPQQASSALAPAAEQVSGNSVQGVPLPEVAAQRVAALHKNAPRSDAQDGSSDRQATEPPASQPGEGFAEERRLLDAARAALTRGEGAAALASIGAHEHRFPNGILIQEREVLAVRALLALGQTDRARSRAQRFHARFPNSVLAPTLESVFEPARRQSTP